LERMVRGHSVVEGGFKWWFGERLLSVWSVPGYGGKGIVGVVKNGIISLDII